MAEPSFADIPDPAGGLAPAAPASPVTAPSEPSLTRGQRGLRRSVVLLLSAAWVSAIVWRLGLRDDVSAMEVILPLALWIAVGAAGLWAAARRRGPGLPPPAPVALAVSIAVPALFAAVAFAWSTPEGLSAEVAEEAMRWATIRACLLVTLLLAAGPVALACFLLRRSFLSAPAWRGAAVGAVCGIAGAAGVHTHCPVGMSGHVLVAHGIPILVAALVGAVLGALRGRV